MSKGTPGVLPEAWRSYVNVDEARIGARTALQDARVLKVAIVEDDDNPLRLVEWTDVTNKNERSRPLECTRVSVYDETG